jgi:hypothetical protein
MITLKQFGEFSYPFKLIPSIIFLRYGLESMYVNEIQQFSSIYNIDRSLDLLDYQISNSASNWQYILYFGIFFRIVAWILLVCTRQNSFFQNFIRNVNDIYKYIFGCSLFVQLTKVDMKKKEKISNYIRYINILYFIYLNKVVFFL